MRTLSALVIDEDGRPALDTDYAISPFFPMQEHLRTLNVFNPMQLPRISAEALKNAIEMGQTKEAA